MKNKIKIILLFTILLACATCKPFRKWDYMYVANQSSRNLYVSLQFDYPDSNLLAVQGEQIVFTAQIDINNDHRFGTPWTFEETMEHSNSSGVLTLFCVEQDTIDKYSYEIVRNQNLYWKRIEKSVDQMKANNWKITITE